MTDSTTSCPLVVNLYSTLGGISLYACLSKIPLSSSSFSLLTKVLLLEPFSVFLNFRYLTDVVVQHNGIKISRMPLFVIILRSLAVCFIGAWHPIHKSRTVACYLQLLAFHISLLYLSLCFSWIYIRFPTNHPWFFPELIISDILTAEQPVVSKNK